MHIYIIAQHLELADQNPDRLVKLGQRLAEEEHEVTIITGSSSIDLNMEKKKVGMVHKKGMPVIALNVPADREQNWLKRYFYLLKFARLAVEQVKMLPKPGLILALAPPLTAVKPALELSEHYKVPLIVELRELWPVDLVERGELRGGLLVKALTGLEEKVYSGACKLIFDSEKVASAVKKQSALEQKIIFINNQLSFEQQYETYRLAVGLNKE